MRQLIYYVACSVDGFIAQKDGVVDAFPGSAEPALAERFP